MLQAPLAHGPVGTLDELAEMAIPLVPLLVLSAWSFGRELGSRVTGTVRQIRSRPMAEDVICGMDVKATPDAIQSTFEGKTYYFCSESCKRTFDKDPRQYTDQ
jgi:YHS domain-containing protein